MGKMKQLIICCRFLEEKTSTFLFNKLLEVMIVGGQLLLLEFTGLSPVIMVAERQHQKKSL